MDRPETPPETPEEAQARQRFMLIGLVRMGGVALILIGILFANDALPITVPPIVAYIMVALGMVETFLIPTLMARRWSTKKRP